MIDFDFDFSDQDWIRAGARLASTLLTVLLLAWILRRARRGEPRRSAYGDEVVLGYGPALRWLFPLFAFGFGALTLFVTHFNPAGVEQLEAKIFWPVVLVEGLAVVGALETWGVRIVLSEHAITSRSPWTGRRRLLWGEVQRVHFSESWQWFVVRGSDGTHIYLHVLLTGLSAFRAKLVERLPSEVSAPAEPYFRRLGVSLQR